ncbi:MAG TPA: hypothetical protein VMR70_08615 [Flavisolibacter sp.]|nr:hypothetical protein [Flavisolibacter sp.]
MFRFCDANRKKFAALLFLVLLTETLAPNLALALTSGPAQPEMKSFEPVGTSDMVDLFTGDFTYNIPLVDVGGYPINLSYHSGSGMDDEASWVGLGWSLNPGVINRQMRGLPDDFNGQDEVVKEKNMKDHITKGINVKVKVDLLGVPGLKKAAKKKKKKIKVSPSISLGVKYDNYRGIGTQLGVNSGLSIGEVVSGTKTAGLGSEETAEPSFIPTGSVNFGLNLSSMDGASTNLNFNVIKNATEQSNYSLSGSVGFPYNSRAGLQGMTLGASFSNNKSSSYLERKLLSQLTSYNSSISFVGNTYTPTIDFPTKNNAYTVDISGGGQLQLFYLGGGITGFYSKQQLAYNKINKPAYGFLYSQNGKDDINALMDLNREKDIPYSEKINYLPIPVPTNDLYSVSSQVGGGQYRIHRGGSGVFFDPQTEGIANDLSLGIELGAGTYFDIGGDFHFQKTSTTSKKWTGRNAFLGIADYKAHPNPLHEEAYFKRVGEPVITDAMYALKINGTSAVAAKLQDKLFERGLDGAGVSAEWRTSNKGVFAPGAIAREKRDVRNNSFSYLTAAEASAHGFSKTIQSYPLNTIVLANCVNESMVENVQRVDPAFSAPASGFSKTKKRRPHHISEITITAEDGKRMMYGIPVYNTYQEEVSFSVDEDLSKRADGIINYHHNDASGDNSPRNSKGRDNYFSREKMPGYATSYLLTEILSADYVDKKGDGVTDDDLGTAVKLNYTRISQDYKWRTPYEKANYNEGFLSDKKDDKASYVYGEKEVWYMHSLESKTMVAMFIMEDREDGLGVLNSAGGRDAGMRLKKLKEIRLYSKADLVTNKANISAAVPIKTVHFEYDYSTQSNLPNNVSGGGKLTLKKVYFTFNSNGKGRLNPYEFHYKSDVQYNNYAHRQYDRWGSFKSAAANPGGLNNSEFPYTLEDRSLTDHFAGLWQLNKITLPSGGEINVTYESDDYAYVQNRRASEMCFLSGINATGSTSGLIDADEVFIRLPRPLSSFGNFSNDVERKNALRYRYFDKLDYLYFKFFIDLNGKGNKEFVPGYAKILDFRYVNDNTVAVKLEKWGDERGRATNPVAFTAWQFMKDNLPRLAYPGYENLDDDGSDFKKAVQSLVNALGSIKELTQGFSGIARRQGYCDKVDLEKSWVRLTSSDLSKMGGGARVKTVTISDAWSEMVGSGNGKTASYTQAYSYTTQADDETGRQIEISSGVASYEPLIGSDENPFHKPVFYQQKVPLFLTNHSYLEEPFGESFFPSPVVGYSRVTVKNIGADQSVTSTGTVVNEFYTAKDYPTKVQTLTLEKRKPGFEKILKLLRISIRDLVGLSQGYAVENNDMHGKPKMTIVQNQGGSEISKQEYFYKNENDLAETKSLSNNVQLLYPDGQQREGIIGQEVEVFTDMRQQTTENYGLGIQASGGSGAVAIWPIPFVFPGVGPNNEYRNYRASSTIKLVNKFSLLEKVIKTENGSSITTENIAWDPKTGEVLLTKVQNEFDDPVYNFTYPAHWAYERMGQAYQNIGTYLAGFSTNAQGIILNASYLHGPENILLPGDELIDLNTTKKYWVVFTNGNYRLINEKGQVAIVYNASIKVLRSGRRNMQDAAIATITSLQNPIVNNQLDISTVTKVLDAKATVFTEEWKMPSDNCITCPDGFTLSDDGTQCYKDEVPTLPSQYEVCEGDQIGQYSACGTYVYQCGGSGLTRTRIGLNNPFWNGNPTDYNSFGYDASNSSQQSYGMWCESASKRRLAITKTPVQKNDSSSNIYLSSKAENKSTSTANLRNSTVSGPLNRCGIWACGATREPFNVWLGFERQIAAPQSKTYYLGIGSDNEFRVIVDGTLRFASDTTLYDQENFKLWHIFPLYLGSGTHTIRFEAKNSGAFASFGAELYNNTIPQLDSATSYSSLDTLFSTANMVGQHFNSGDTACQSGATRVIENGVVKCRTYAPAVDGQFNPYQTGYLGNWRPLESNVYHIDRSMQTNDTDASDRTNIRKGGVYSYFTAFWIYDGGTGFFVPNTNDNNWIAASQTTLVNEKGVEVENKDALGRYSSALYGYLESLPVAVASNAQAMEIAYDGLEDYNFDLRCSLLSGNCDSLQSAFSFRKFLNGTSVTNTDEEAHTGKYSLKLSASNGVTITKATSDPLEIRPSYHTFNGYGEFLHNPMGGVKQFSPVEGKKYVFSCWVKDGAETSLTTPVRVAINGNNTYITNNSKWPLVEGWKRIEFPFIMPAGQFQLQISPGGGTAYFDDVRIHPFDGQLKSFAYDPSSLRLMAEMDENNMATFYEYDDEGILIRVKKETEQGLATLKETRSSLRKRN